IAVDKGSDTTNKIYQYITHASIFNVIKSDDSDIQDRLKKGRITAVLSIRDAGSGKYDVHIKTTSAGQRELPGVQSVLNGIINEISQESHPVEKVATVSSEEIPGRVY